ncbi:MAG: diacylglycerol kinase family protein [Candidatus Falkowbacteria bacterium]
MYTYIYDNELADKKYFAPLTKIESRITELGLGGRVVRMNNLRNSRDALLEEIRRVPETLVVIGGDQLMSQTISLIGGSGIPLGLIPLGTGNKLAASLGINEENAVNVLSARRLVQMDLGIVDDRTFLKKAELFGSQLALEVDELFVLHALSDLSINIYNYLAEDEANYLPKRPVPTSGDLTLAMFKEMPQGFFKKEISREVSSINFKHLAITGEDVRAILDDYVEVKSPREVRILEKALDVIVGKERDF